MRATLAATMTAIGLLALAAPAHAGVLASPGVYFGTGNGNTDWTVTTENRVELGLDTLIRYTNEVAPTTGNVYNVALGDTSVTGKTGSLWGFAFSAINQNGPLSALTLSLSILDVRTGNTVTLDPKLIGDNGGTDGTNTVGGSSGCLSNPTASACTVGTQTGIQNAEAPSFSFIDPNYNSALDDTFVITLSATDGRTTESVSEIVVAGTGVPEPASFALLGAGLIGLSTLQRRRRS